MKIDASGFWPVPVLSISVRRSQIPTEGRPMEYTHTDVESYFITPEDARSGEAAHKLTYLEAVQRLIV